MQPTTRDYCSFQITLLKQTGIWPVDGEFVTLFVLQRCVLYSQMLTLFLISLALTLGAVFSDDLKNMSGSVDILTLTLSAMYKAWYVTSHIDAFRSLIATMGRAFRPVVHNRNGNVISVAEDSKYCSLYTTLLVVSGAVVIAFYSITPVLEHAADYKGCNSTEEWFRKLKFPMVTWIPFDVYWSPVFEIVYVAHCYGLFASANIYLVNDSFLFVMIYQVYVQMKMLSEMLANVGNGNMDYTDYMDEGSEILSPIENNYRLASAERSEQQTNDINKINYEDSKSKLNLDVIKAIKTDQNEIQLKLKKCIAFHRDILGVITNIEELSRSMILADVLHAIISLSFALHETAVTESIYDRIKMYLFLVVCIVHQFCNSYFGQMLLNAQEMISNAAYNLQWCDANIQTKKYLILIMARSNKFTVLSGGKMYYLRFQSFILFMKTIFSYYMVLRQASIK